MKVILVLARHIMGPYMNSPDMFDTLNILKFHQQSMCTQQARKEFILPLFRKMFLANAAYNFLFLFHLNSLWSSFNNCGQKFQLSDIILGI